MHLLKNHSRQPQGSNCLMEPSLLRACYWQEHFTNGPKKMAKKKTNTEKQPDEWASRDDPMTGAQASYLKTLSEEAGDPDAYDETLTKAEAWERIDATKPELGLE